MCWIMSIWVHKIRPVCVLSIKLFNSSKNNTHPFFIWCLSHSTQLCVVLGSIMLSRPEPGPFLCSGGRAFCQSSSIWWGWNCIRWGLYSTATASKTNVKPDRKKSNYLMPFKSLLKTVESRIFRAVASGLWPPFCCYISLHYEAYFLSCFTQMEM